MVSTIALCVWLVIGFFVTKFTEWSHDRQHIKKGEEPHGDWPLSAQLVTTIMWPVLLSLYIGDYIDDRREKKDEDG